MILLQKVLRGDPVESTIPNSSISSADTKAVVTRTQGAR